ncbi:hypothetical protein AK830_g3358 [Neonectria ditissima]|uniref:F-box domain-containing protein n=1 Tax=Neonectria ditissima TaxID=78410 RepID=A0A0P7BI99_9HYPO|nr:hypothetical protein AK830_g3358 [Neonectria ditissima]
MASQHHTPSSTTSSRGLAGLPAELIVAVASHLPNRDRKSLRLTCTSFGQRVLLRIDRVFLSASPLDIEVFKAVADHGTYRKRVTELIWDDACLTMPPTPPRAYQCESRKQHIEPFWQQWFEDACKKNLEEAKYRKGYDVSRADHAARARWMAAQPPADELWEQYKDLLAQQYEILDTNDDALALEYGLSRFPSLRKITLTPATHGAPFTPLYQTPMIRALPYGFNYPMPRGWPSNEEYERVTINEWPTECEDEVHEKNKWRGFRILTRTLARIDHNVSEFVIDVGLLNTGLNGHIFDAPCKEYADLFTLLRKPGFRRVDLALLVGGQHRQGWLAFRNGQLQRALGSAADLEHVSLVTNAHYEHVCYDWEDNTDEHFVPLRSIFPADKWPKLRHFGLSGFIVRLSDVVSLLAALPPTLRSVELSFLHFQDEHGSHRELLQAMRDTLGWRERAVGNRPKVIMGWHPMGMCMGSGRAIWIDDEVNAFIYEKGNNPFLGTHPDGLYQGGTERDVFEPAHERPYADIHALEQLGIVTFGGN